MQTKSNLAKDILLGVAVADALGAPVEFESASAIDAFDIESNYACELDRTKGFGTWNKPIGTFTDDTSMTLCTAEYLAMGVNDHSILMNLFANWKYHDYWTADNHTFDIGITTSIAIDNYLKEQDWKTCGLGEVRNNGNGSLMRILPLLFPFLKMKQVEGHRLIQEISALTHAHTISVRSCIIYIEFASILYSTKNGKLAFEQLSTILPKEILEDETFSTLFDGDFLTLEPQSFNCSGYVLGTLQIALYSVLTTSNYQDAVVQAILHGGDTDTNAAVTGGLAGILYGSDNIPESWSVPLKRKEDIITLADKLRQHYILS